MAAVILVVDDEPHICKVISYKLRKEGYETVEATCAEEAWAVLEKRKVDLVLLDVALATPTDGFSLARELRSRPDTASIPIVMLTARASPSDIRLSRKLGASGYVTKPFTLKELVAKIRSLLDPVGG